MPGPCTHAYREKAALPVGGVLTLGSTRRKRGSTRASVPVLVRSSRPRARYAQACPSALLSATPSPAHASSATAWSVSSASHSRQSWPVATWSSGLPAARLTAIHSSRTRSGICPRRLSAHALHWLPASTTAVVQLAWRAGGQRTLGGRAKRNAYDRSRMTFVRAKTSGGQSSSSSVIDSPDAECHTEASVGSSTRA